MRFTLPATALACGALAACASAPGGSRPAGRPSPFDISTAQIDALPAGESLLEAVRRLRPDFLLARGQSPREPGGSMPSLYVNGAPHGDARVLATMPAALAASVRYVRPAEARQLYGVPHSGGIILVTTRR